MTERPSWFAVRVAPEEFLLRYEEWILPEDAADNDHRMRSHNVDHRIFSDAILFVVTVERAYMTQFAEFRTCEWNGRNGLHGMLLQ